MKLRSAATACIMALFLTLAIFTTGAFAQSASTGVNVVSAHALGSTGSNGFGGGNNGCGNSCGNSCGNDCGAGWVGNFGDLGSLGVLGGHFDVSRFGDLGCLGIFGNH